MNPCKPKPVHLVNDEFEKLYSQFKSPSSKAAPAKNKTQVDDEFEKLYNECPAAKILEQLCNTPPQQQRVPKPKLFQALISPQARNSKQFKMRNSTSSLPPKVLSSLLAPNLLPKAVEPVTSKVAPAGDNSRKDCPKVPSSPLQVVKPVAATTSKLAPAANNSRKECPSSPVQALTPLFVAQNNHGQNDSGSNTDDANIVRRLRHTRSHQRRATTTFCVPERDLEKDRGRHLRKKKKKKRHSLPASAQQNCKKSKSLQDNPIHHQSSSDDLFLLDSTDYESDNDPQNGSNSDPRKRNAGDSASKSETDTDLLCRHPNTEDERTPGVVFPSSTKMSTNSFLATSPAVRDSTTLDKAEEEADKTTEDQTITMKVDDSKAVVLDNWVVQICPGGIRIEGHLRGESPDEFWHSSKIAERLSSRLLKTSSGSLYKLVGEMDKETFFNQGSFPRHLMEEFIDGFPENWKSLLDDHFQQDKPTKGKATVNVEAEPMKKLTRNAEKRWKKTKSRKTIKNDLSDSFLARLKQSGTKEDPILVDSLPRTRSGRAVIPQLAWWTNQRALIRPETNALEVVQGTPNTLPERYLNFKTDERIQVLERRALQRKIQEKLNTSRHRKSPRLSDDGILSTDTSTKAYSRNSKKQQNRKSQCRYSTRTNQKMLSAETSAKTDLEESSANTDLELSSAKTDYKQSSSKSDLVENSSSAHFVEGKNSQKTAHVLDTVSQTQTDAQTGSGVGQGLTEEERAYNESLKKALEILEKKDSSFSSVEEASRPETGISNGKKTEKISGETSKSDTSTGERSDREKENVDLLDFGLNAEIAAVVSARKAKREKEKQELRNSRNPCYRSPHIQLTNVFDMKKNTPQALLQRAMDNMPSGMKKALRDKHKGRKNASTRSEPTEMKSKQVLHSRNKSREAAADSSTQKTPTVAAVVDQGECKRDILSQDFSHVAEEVKDTKAKMRRNSHQSSHTKVKRRSRRFSRTRAKSSNHRSPPPSSSESEHEDPSGERPWTPAEIKRYESAYKELPLAEPWFWTALATSVGTRTEQECKDFHFKDAPSTTTKKKCRTKTKQPKEQITAPSQITGGKGTLKRKRQIQELIENHNKDYSDDIFGSTPFKNMSQIKVPKFSSKSVYEDFRTPEPYRTPRSKRQKTDAFQTPHHHIPRPQPISEKRTPTISNLISPGLPQVEDRKTLEGYVHRLKKNQRGRKWGVLPSKKKASGTKQQQKKTKQNITDDIATELFHPDKNVDYGESDSEDYYFSDLD